MSEWQDIETAPKDGTDILCASDSYNGCLILSWYKINGLFSWRDWDGDTHVGKVYWMPLPKLPKDIFK